MFLSRSHSQTDLFRDDKNFHSIMKFHRCVVRKLIIVTYTVHQCLSSNVSGVCDSLTCLTELVQFIKYA